MSNEIVTFGCRLNAYESQLMQQHADQAGLKDAIILNSCAVTAEAERQLRQTIRKKRREHPNAKIIVTGCAAQVHPEDYASMDEVDLVLGNEEKLHAGEWQFLASDMHEPIRVNDIMSVEETAAHMLTSFEGKSRAFVQVQNGCNHRCTFCIIPYGRGNSRSVPMGEVVTQLRALVEQGFQEVVLTGVDISDYGEDLPGEPTLGELCQRLLKNVPELPRLRLSSIDAVEVDDTLYRLLAEEPRLMPHLHISLQAGDDMVLKRMKRRHLRQDIVDFCAKVKDLRPDIVFGADIIAGFPTETDDMFANTRRLLDEIPELIHMHIFPYSKRPGTPAARMPQVAGDVRKARAKQLREAGERNLQHYLSRQINASAQVLVEKDGEGHSEHFAKVRIEGAAVSDTQIVPARITGVDGETLLAQAA